MFPKKSIVSLDVEGKKVLLRVDFNVPLAGGRVADDTRLKAALPTIEALLGRGAALILCSHLGRPMGLPDPEFSLAPVADSLSDLLGRPVQFVKDCIGEQASSAAAALSEGQVLLLENTRFYPGEKSNDPEFARSLADLADVYVNDAFGSAHRAHASTVGVTEYLPSAAGLLLQKEIEQLNRAVQSPERPYVAILGGAKISDKIQVVERFLELADRILIGGGMANTFLAAKGLDMQDSLVEKGALDIARDLLSKGSHNLVLPVDLVAADEFAADAEKRVVSADAVPQGWRALDIGPETLQRFIDEIDGAAMVVWNGPMGVFEFERFAEGTLALARALAGSEAISIVGGGDSAAAVQRAGVADQLTHVSTGGGASLTVLEGSPLPGVEALDDA